MLRRILNPEGVNPYMGLSLGGDIAEFVLSLAIAVSALVVAMRALSNGERSWLVWSGMLLALLVGGLCMVWMIAGLLYYLFLFIG